jgi:hypothetical protein
MASKLYSYYLKAGTMGGVKARTRLSILTKVTSIQASSIIDTEDNIRQFEDAMKQIAKEFGNGTAINSIATTSSTIVGAGDQTYYLRKHINIISDLTAQRAIFIGDITAACKRITESLVDAIHVERSSVWLFDEDKTLIKCEDLCIRSNHEHQNGVQLFAKDFPRYFASIRAEKTVAANDAHTDPRTSEFSESYLKPLGINSMLDVPIWAEGKMAGVICNEHVGPIRKWTTDEENFVYMVANIIAMSIEMQKKVPVLI